MVQLAAGGSSVTCCGLQVRPENSLSDKKSTKRLYRIALLPKSHLPLAIAQVRRAEERAEQADATRRALADEVRPVTNSDIKLLKRFEGHGMQIDSL